MGVGAGDQADQHLVQPGSSCLLPTSWEMLVAEPPATSWPSTVAFRSSWT